jgi:hypothetical protein
MTASPFIGIECDQFGVALTGTDPPEDEIGVLDELVSFCATEADADVATASGKCANGRCVRAVHSDPRVSLHFCCQQCEERSKTRKNLDIHGMYCEHRLWAEAEIEEEADDPLNVAPSTPQWRAKPASSSEGNSMPYGLEKRGALESIYIYMNIYIYI